MPDLRSTLIVTGPLGKVTFLISGDEPATPKAAVRSYVPSFFMRLKTVSLSDSSSSVKNITIAPAPPVPVFSKSVISNSTTKSPVNESLVTNPS